MRREEGTKTGKIIKFHLKYAAFEGRVRVWERGKLTERKTDPRREQEGAHRSPIHKGKPNELW